MPQYYNVQPSAPLQLGWIPYLNLLPLRHELERTTGRGIEFLRGHPSQVNRWLSEGRVALAPSSSVCLLRNSALEIAFPMGIAATGPVQSVYIGLPRDDAGLLELIKGRQAMLRDIFRQGQTRYDGDSRKVASYVFRMAATLPPLEIDVPPPLQVTPASASGAQLARILYRLWFGEAAYEMRAAEGGAAAAPGVSLRKPMEVVIGDEALVKRPGYRIVIDLAEAWRDLTDLPFVFAVWQMSKANPLNPYWRQRITEAAELAQARMRVEPSHYFPDMPVTDINGRPVDLGAYWKVIQYRLGPQHFKGLALFLTLTRCLQPLVVDDQAVVNIMRWESMGQSAATQL